MRFLICVVLLLGVTVQGDSMYFKCVRNCDSSKPIEIYKACCKTCALVHGPQGKTLSHRAEPGFLNTFLAKIPFLKNKKST